MVSLHFTLSPASAARVHDVLVCLSKFSDTVAIEARSDRFSFTALNSSKSAYTSFTFDISKFFTSYQCASTRGSTDENFTCQIYNKALQSVFKSRLNDPRSQDTAIDTCEVSLLDSRDEVECRLIIKMVADQGVTKTYRLTYEAAEVMHALFDRSLASNHWSIQAALIKEYVEFFGAKTEQLDIYSEDDRVSFTSFTEKIANGKEILKQPLHTVVSVNKADFNSFDAQDKMHTIISVRDFKAVALHANTLKAEIRAYYSFPTRPLQFKYEADGIDCEFTLMTSGEYNGPPAPSPAQATSRAGSTSQFSRQIPPISAKASTTSMPPPEAPASRATSRLKKPGSKRPVSAQPSEAESDSLFVPADDDQRWDPEGDRDEEETIGWDTSADNDAGDHPTFRDSAPTSRSRSEQQDSFRGLAPTQRLSQLEGGLW